MTVMTYQPLSDVARMVFDVFGADEGSPRGAAGLRPAIDIVDLDESILLLADLPGVDRESIDVAVEDGTLTIAAERAVQPELQQGRLARGERSRGRFAREFRLPRLVDAGRITAEYRDGVLFVTLPKADAARARRIEVRSA
jgi:HSP20 family protein